MGRRALVTRDQVLKAAREVFAKRGFDGTTLAVIASRLGISPAALLRHAPTKEALFGAAMAFSDQSLPMPIEFLESLDGSEEPLAVLRKIAERAIPILEATFSETFVHWLHSNRAPAGAVSIELPFDPRSKSTPPEQAYRLIEGYMEKAAKAGRLRVADVRAAAVSFQGALFAYVSFHKLFRIIDPPIPLDRYLDTVLAIWARGAVAETPTRQTASGRERSR
jgi:TetR/AcrR family transcriptional repressor of mexJK operon